MSDKKHKNNKDTYTQINQTTNVIANSIDGISGECNISVFW